MKTSQKHPLSVILFFFIIGFVTFSCTKNPEWVHFTASANTSAVADDGENIWIGGSGLTKINKGSGETTL